MEGIFMKRIYGFNDMRLAELCREGVFELGQDFLGTQERL